MVKDKDERPKRTENVDLCGPLVYVDRCTVGRSPWGEQIHECEVLSPLLSQITFEHVFYTIITCAKDGVFYPAFIPLFVCEPLHVKTTGGNLWKLARDVCWDKKVNMKFWN